MHTLKQLKEKAYLDSPRDFYSWLLSPDGLDCIDGDALSYLIYDNNIMGGRHQTFLREFLQILRDTGVLIEEDENAD